MGRIGIVGYFGWGNYGDELFVLAYNDIFKDCELITFHDVATEALRADADRLIDSVDAIVIGGGDLLIPWSLSRIYWDKRYLRRPIHIFGIGVPTWAPDNPGVLAAYQEYLSHSSVKTIACRDPESAAWIRNTVCARSDIEWYPDLVAGMKFPVKAREPNKVGVIIRSQAGASFEHVSNLIRHIERAGFNVAPIVLATGMSFLDDILVYREVFSAHRVFIANEIDELTDFLGTCGVIVSMKFHGIVAAYAMRIPCLAMSGANKFVDFLALTGNRHAAISYDKDMRDCFDTVASGRFTFARHESIVTKAREGLQWLHRRVLGECSLGA